MSSFQHLDDIDIPDIEITEGWPVSDIKTIDDCNDAFAYLMSACASIEYQIDMAQAAHVSKQDAVWIARARCALKYKKAALQIVGFKRGSIGAEETKAFQRERDRALLTYIRSVVPQHEFLEWVRASNVSGIAREVAA
ncbi:hypothetical protein [Phyllobacterium sp. K27]